MAQHTKLFCVLFSALVTSIPLLGPATPVFAGPIVTPSGNPCLPLSEARTADGLLLSTGLVLFYPAWFVRRFQPFFVQLAVRIAGSWIAATGLILLALRLRE